MTDGYRYPRVGLGVLVLKDGKMLMGRRNKASHAEQVWSLPGGHLEHGESIEGGARREVMEESGIEIQNVRFALLMNQLDYLPKHFVCIGLVSEWKSGEPRPEEGDKMIDWTWYDADKLPSPIYPASKQLIDAYRDGVSFIDPQ